MLLHADAFTHTHTFTHKRFYTQTLLHTEAFTRRCFYTHTYFHTQRLLHTEAFEECLYMTFFSPDSNCSVFNIKHMMASSSVANVCRHFTSEVLSHVSFTASWYRAFLGNLCGIFHTKMKWHVSYTASWYRVFLIVSVGYSQNKNEITRVIYSLWHWNHYPLGAPDPPRGVKNVTYIITFLYPPRNIGVWGG